MTGTPRRCWDREVLPTWYPQQHSAMDTWITMSDSPAFGLGSGSEAEDGQMESKAGVCEGSEGIWLPGGKPWAMASQVSFEEESQKQPAVGHWKPLMPSKGNKEELETGCQDAGGVGETQSTEQLNVSRLRSSSVEIREKGSEFLKDELHKAQKELKLKDKECERLSKVREQLEQELEELTASLFEVDSILFAEFEAWKESPTLDKSCSFLDRIYREDIGPCLDFTKQELSELVRVAVEQNTLTIEPVASQTLPVVKVAAEECGGPNGFRSQIVTKCALSGLPRTCKHRIMLGDSGNYYYISPSCRARITAVCNFFTYIRYIQQGLVRQDVELMYWEVMRLRREMSLAKLGFYPSEM
ncbi:PREDICTED: guanine nucleotide exchange factor for Rab-3A isoform X7 [Lepidothrix coronata]|uniref:Guanine nucleotide exchange factor for Rab-3A isoform X7 n=1 Tax=Lepidothrix coronata TaxID=321398 RepID=A0A6J0I6D6_9PASS|nr:PREDICTED: guanine nucleotide exchange factor for Rab-3A isoform X7 [Lepidothrix coronata]